MNEVDETTSGTLCIAELWQSQMYNILTLIGSHWFVEKGWPWHYVKDPHWGGPSGENQHFGQDSFLQRRLRCEVGCIIIPAIQFENFAQSVLMTCSQDCEAFSFLFIRWMLEAAMAVIRGNTKPLDIMRIEVIPTYDVCLRSKSIFSCLEEGRVINLMFHFPCRERVTRLYMQWQV